LFLTASWTVSVPWVLIRVSPLFSSPRGCMQAAYR
jgi:hypothetical protein